MIAGLRLVRFHAAASAALQHSRGMASMPLTFASPTRVFYNNQGCQQVDVPSFRFGPDSIVSLQHNVATSYLQYHLFGYSDRAPNLVMLNK